MFFTVLVGGTNLPLHSLHCALKVASAYVLWEKSTGLCKSMALSNESPCYVLHDCLSRVCLKSRMRGLRSQPEVLTAQAVATSRGLSIIPFTFTFIAIN